MANDYLCDNGGAEKALFNLKSLLEENNHQVELFGSRTKREDVLSFVSRWFSLKNFIRSLHIINTFKPDIVHAHGLSRKISPSILVAAKIRKIHVVMTFHDYHLICPKTWMIFADNQPCIYGFGAKCLVNNCRTFNNGYRYFPYQWLKWMKVFLHRLIIRMTVDVIICPNLDLKNWVEKSLHLNAIYLPNFSAYKHSTNKEVRKPKYFLYVGRLSPEKGVSNLVNTFIKVNREKLVIIGDGSEREKLEKIVSDRRAEKIISFLGEMENFKLSSYYRGAYALIVPSVCKENNPLVVIESLAMGTPVIASNRGGLPDFVDNGAACLIYNNEGGLINCLQTIKKNRKIVLLPEMYSKEHHLAILITIYRTLLAPRLVKTT